MDDNSFGIPEFETIFELILVCIFVLTGFGATVYMYQFLEKKVEVNSYVDKIKVSSIDAETLDPFTFNGYEALMMSVIMDKYSTEPITYQMVMDTTEQHSCWYDDATGYIGTEANEPSCLHMTGISPAGTKNIKFEDYQIHAIQGGTGVNMGTMNIPGSGSLATYVGHLPIKTAVQFMASTHTLVTPTSSMSLCNDASVMINFYREGRVKLCLRNISTGSPSYKEMKKWRWVLVPQ